MKFLLPFCLVLAGYLLLPGSARADAAATNAAAAKLVVPTPPPKSIFTIPTATKEGRDPFFPESSRIYDLSAPVAAKVVAAPVLLVKGFSVVNGHPMVILNNHSFMSGDEGDVTTGSGRTHVRCLEIKAGAVIVEINGSRQTIHF